MTRLAWFTETENRFQIRGRDVAIFFMYTRLTSQVHLSRNTLRSFILDYSIIPTSGDNFYGSFEHQWTIYSSIRFKRKANIRDNLYLRFDGLENNSIHTVYSQKCTYWSRDQCRIFRLEWEWNPHSVTYDSSKQLALITARPRSTLTSSRHV